MRPVPVVHVHPMGRTANLAIQYMVAMKIAEYLDGAIISNVSIPELGVNVPEIPPGDPARTYTIYTQANLDLLAIIEMVKSGKIDRIEIQDYVQKTEFFLDRSAYVDVFKTKQEGLPVLRDDELVINIRSGEVLDGVSHYPLTPIEFYHDLVVSTGLRPVFVGQLDPCFYYQEIRKRFPNARMIASQGAARDFELLKTARNTVVAVSTFSWLAAWLSEARTIYLPLHGFFNPAHLRHIDILTPQDPRFRFFLFPLVYGRPERESLAHHKKIDGQWREVSATQVEHLRRKAPFLKADISQLPAGFDGFWYAHEYLEAAHDISNGWFDGPEHHYMAVGRQRGYGTHRPATQARARASRDPDLADIARGKDCTQSSLSKFSKGRTREEDAANAVDGRITGVYSFCTDHEEFPWWQIDLGSDHVISEVEVYNQIEHPSLMARASPFVILVSRNCREWDVVFRLSASETFGGADGNPLVWQAQEETVARYVKLMVGRPSRLHLAQVQVFGKPAESDALHYAQ